MIQKLDRCVALLFGTHACKHSSNLVVSFCCRACESALSFREKSSKLLEEAHRALGRVEQVGHWCMREMSSQPHRSADMRFASHPLATLSSRNTSLQERIDLSGADTAE